ncbi:hypothetical protein [Methylovulum miyakonense]|uniref:hypothetical protein n=1 Tax=Methylovulum miyakonense TaxID=645578 RepID=UPI001E3D13A1|nr:hypothetical protein [Methylovulum miyakonense]
MLPRKLVAGIQTVDLSTNRGVDIPLPDAAPFYFNTSIQSIRASANAYEAIRALVKISPDVSMAVVSYVRLANTELRFKVFDMGQQLSDDGSKLLLSILTNLTHLNDYSYGYDDRQPLSSVSETMLNEILLTGACAMELVLDKVRLPFRLQPVSPSKLRWRISPVDTGNGTNHKIIPWQQLQGATVILDIPTFFSARLDHDVTVTYPKPPLESALNAAVFNAEVLEDIRRAVRRSGHSRLVVTLNTEMVMKAMPTEARGDFNKQKEWMDSVRSALETQIAGLNPESGLVLWDTAEVDYLNSQIGASGDYGPLMDIVDGQSSTALHTPLSILGKRTTGGSQSISSSESLLFLKHVEGIRKPVEAVWARALTLALRLYGFEGYVEAKYDPVNLRPEDELEAFKQMKQARILELLSLGFKTDQEAAQDLNTGLRAPGAPPLSGTMFYEKGKQAMDPKAVANGGDPTRRALTGDAPQKSGGASQ